MKRRNSQGMLVLNLVSHPGRSPKPRFGVHLDLPNCLSFRPFPSGLKSFTHLILFGLREVREKRRHSSTRDSCDFFDGQTADKKLETPAEVSCRKNVFVTIRYIAEYVFRISISNDFPELIGFRPDQLAFPSGRGMTGDCTARGGLLGHVKVTYDGFPSLHRGQGGHLSGTFSCAGGWSCHGGVGEGRGDAAGDGTLLVTIRGGEGTRGAAGDDGESCSCNQFDWSATWIRMALMNWLIDWGDW